MLHQIYLVLQMNLHGKAQHPEMFQSYLIHVVRAKYSVRIALPMQTKA